jgi:UPF0716 family protein affecting phage T7 exclusion
MIAAVIGVKLAKWHGGRVVQGFLLGTAGRHAIGALGGVLIVLPGVGSDLLGILLLLPPVQALFGRAGNLIMAAIVRRQMAKMGMPLPGAAGSFPASFGQPGAGPGRVPRTIDTTAERTAHTPDGR